MLELRNLHGLEVAAETCEVRQSDCYSVYLKEFFYKFFYHTFYLINFCIHYLNIVKYYFIYF